MVLAMIANTEQSEYWNAAAGDSWVAEQDHMDVQLAPLGQAVLAALGITAGERVLDVGCGAGTTTASIAKLGAKATGTDISAPLIARAKERYPECEFILGDAQTHAFTGFDAVFSRFGVMFFNDPVAAFANLGRAVAPKGRIGFVCWRTMRENPTFTIPLAAAATAGLPLPEPGDPHAPGPCAFADRDRLESILRDAGWSSISIAAHDEMVGGNTLEESVHTAQRIGPLARLLREHPEFRDRAIKAIREQLSAHIPGGDGKVVHSSATWIVTASRG